MSLDLNFLKKIKSLGYLIKIDTNGSFPERLQEFVDAGLIDYVAMDIKYYPFSKYGKFETKVRESIKLIINSGINSEFRSTCVPGMLSKSGLIEIAKFIREGKKYYLQQFKNEGCMKKEFEKIEPYSKDKLEEFARECSLFISTKVRG